MIKRRFAKERKSRGKSGYMYATFGGIWAGKSQRKVEEGISRDPASKSSTRRGDPSFNHKFHLPLGEKLEKQATADSRDLERGGLIDSLSGGR